MTDILELARKSGASVLTNGVEHRVTFSDATLSAFTGAVRQEERERAAEACKSVLDEKEEARAERASREAKGTEDELTRLKHWATVSTYNAGVRRCIAAILAQPEQKR